MKPATLTTLFLLSTTSFAAGCDAPGEPGADAVEFRCIRCGDLSNSPAVNDFAVPEINLNGLANSDGVKVKGIRRPLGHPTTTLYRLGVGNDELNAWSFSLNGAYTVASGPGLIGWRIELEGPGGVVRHATIRAHNPELASWSAGAAPISTYAIAYDSDPGPSVTYVNVCPNATPEETVLTVIGGETYDRDTKEVNPGMSGWATLACADEAAFKMKRLAYGPNDTIGATGVTATVAQRQATLKMLTGDYCGTGFPYTVQGFPLKWTDQASNVNWTSGAVLEARWDEHGATCLTLPRVAELGEVACIDDLDPCPVGPHDAVWQTGFVAP